MHGLPANDMTLLVSRTAERSDLPVLDLLREDALSRPQLRQSGQWHYSPERAARARASRLESLDAGTVRLLSTRFGVPVATFCLDDRVDREFWTPAECSDAMSIHGTIVGTWASGYGVGSAIHDLASKLVRREGKAWLRLDAWRTSYGLHDVYEQDEFDYVRTVALPHRESGVLFQRAAGMVRRLGPAIIDGAATTRATESNGLV